ncbi:hypothetical protein AURDEDRAFT_161615 [Auricularia subglabra TFB-10046 SS5]|nr:hypothetical protein AURDEDRAFT_161615 [Auricularia subglabra TFB-10046 SS5]
MSSESSCVIDADPDIAGIGVRLAIYLQALLPLASTFVTPHSSIRHLAANARLVEQYCQRGNASLVLFSATNAALVIAALIKHGTRTLSPYHALVVLNLTWIILIGSCCRATLMYYIKRHADNSKHRMPSSWAELRRFISSSSNRRQIYSYYLYGGVLILHLTACGALGWLLFGDIEGFARGAGCPHETVLWMLTCFIPVTNPGLRRFWLFTYILTALSLVSFPIVLGVAVFFSFLSLILVSALVARLAIVLRHIVPGIQLSVPLSTDRCLRVSEALAITLLVLLIISTEKTIIHNPVGDGESAWGFGQVLALILSIFPFWDAVKGLLMGLRLRRESKSMAQLLCLSRDLTLHGVTFENRVFVTPKTTEGFHEGLATDRLLVHVARIAAGKPGAILLKGITIFPDGGRTSSNNSDSDSSEEHTPATAQRLRPALVAAIKRCRTIDCELLLISSKSKQHIAMLCPQITG